MITINRMAALTVTATLAVTGAATANTGFNCDTITHTGWSPGTHIVETIATDAGPIRVTNRILPRDSSYPMPASLQGTGTRRVTVTVENRDSGWTGTQTQTVQCGALVPPTAPEPPKNPVPPAPTPVNPPTPTPTPVTPPRSNPCPITGLNLRISTRRNVYGLTNATVRFTVRNVGGARTRGATVLRYRLPAGATILKRPSNSTHRGRLVTVRMPAIRPGAQRRTAIRIRWTARGGSVIHAARATSGCAVAANDTAVTWVRVPNRREPIVAG